MPNDKKSTMMASRHHEAKKKAKQSVSDYHNQLLTDNCPAHLTSGEMRQFSTLDVSGMMKTGETRSRRTLQLGIPPPGVLGAYPGLSRPPQISPRSQSTMY